MDNVIQDRNPEPEKLNLVNKTVGIFTQPERVLASLKERPDWLFPLTVVILISILFAVTTRRQMMEFQKQSIYNSTIIQEEQKDEMIDRMENQSDEAFYVQSVGGTVVSTIFVYLVAAGVFLFVGNFILGGKASFKQIFAMYSWVGLISGLEYLIKIPLVLAKDSFQVYTSLAVLLDPSQSKTLLFQILNAFDLFAIWRVALWGMGFAVIYNFSKRTSYTAVISVYVIYLAIAIAISQMF